MMDPTDIVTKTMTKIVFSYDRPLQLWGLVKSITDNSDLEPQQIVCVSKSSGNGYRKAYDLVSAELGCRVIHEEPPPAGLRRRFWKGSLYDRLLGLAQDAGYVSLAVDDMVYHQRADFARASDLLKNDPDVCLWSWRIGHDLQPSEAAEVAGDHWRADRTLAVMPYRYVFHTDGSVFRAGDFRYWLGLLPRLRRRAMNLNDIEARLSRYTKPKRAARLRLGRIHAGPLAQACVTWQVNKVASGGSEHFSDVPETRPEALLAEFEAGRRLDYSPLYGRMDWLLELNQGWPHAHTHLAPTEAAWRLWAGCITAG